MKIHELIERLQQIEQKQGNVNVKIAFGRYKRCEYDDNEIILTVRAGQTDIKEMNTDYNTI